jgi:hypothetical protein
VSEPIDHIKRHAPTLGIAVAAALVTAQLVMPDAPGMPALPALPAEIQAAKAHPRRASDRLVKTRLVACGDSTQASVTGDDLVGVVTLGPGAGGACTVLFASKWSEQPYCIVEGGTVAAIDETDLIVSGVTGPAFAYRCAPRDESMPAQARPSRPEPPVEEPSP